MKTENMEDRLFGDKLSALSDLPDGYSPNLESKWAILETSLNENAKNRKKFFWTIRIAASLLLTSIFALFYQNNKLKEEKPVPSALAAAPITKQVHSTQVRSKDAPTPAGDADHKFMRRNPIVPTPPSDSLHTDQIISDDLQMTNSNQNLQEELIVKSDEMAVRKKKKSRYIQLDFGESNIEYESNQAPQLYTSGFQLKLLPRGDANERETKDAHNPKTIRINL